jgi:hypothetical protein
VADNGILAWAQAILGGTSTEEGTLVSAAYSRLSKAISSVSSAGRITWAQGITYPPVVVSGTTLTLSADAHDSKFVVLTSLSGCTITLPAATGSGAHFNIIVGATLTSGSVVLQVASATDYLRGQAYTFVTTTASTFGTANTGTVSTESDTITFNRTTTGLGTIGDYIEVVDIGAAIWAIEADYASSGTAATPFSVAV